MQGAQERHTSIHINRDCLDTTKTAERHPYSYLYSAVPTSLSSAFLLSASQKSTARLGRFGTGHVAAGTCVVGIVHRLREGLAVARSDGLYIYAHFCFSRVNFGEELESPVSSSFSFGRWKNGFGRNWTTLGVMERCMPPTS